MLDLILAFIELIATLVCGVSSSSRGQRVAYKDKCLYLRGNFSNISYNSKNIYQKEINKKKINSNYISQSGLDYSVIIENGNVSINGNLEKIIYKGKNLLK